MGAPIPTHACGTTLVAFAPYLPRAKGALQTGQSRPRLSPGQQGQAARPQVGMTLQMGCKRRQDTSTGFPVCQLVVAASASFWA